MKTSGANVCHLLLLRPKTCDPDYLSDVATKNPIVFCHGLLGFDTVTLGPSIAPLQVTHWRGIRDALEANGSEVRPLITARSLRVLTTCTMLRAQVLITRVPATSSPIDRAKVLCAKIAETYPGRAVHLIGTCPYVCLCWRAHADSRMILTQDTAWCGSCPSPTHPIYHIHSPC